MNKNMIANFEDTQDSCIVARSVFLCDLLLLLSLTGDRRAR